MKIHVLGIGGTFMSGIALLAKQKGYQVSGSDGPLYPPMSTQLKAQNIEVKEGYAASHIEADVEQVIVGNVIKRGNPAMEYVLEKNIPYISGPQWLFEQILRDRWVLAVAGTHGKTTTTSLLTWILFKSGLKPGFLIGGIPENFDVSANLGEGKFFVIEADEYDSAFFDKRSKFLHYHPKTLILNNLEYDHADIFPNIEAILQQFHYLIRTVPANGKIIYKEEDSHLRKVLKQGCWTPTVGFGMTQESTWCAALKKADGSIFTVTQALEEKGEVNWNLLGHHNVENALAALAAATAIGISPETAIQSLSTFKGVKRRLEVKGCKNNIMVYDDFAHHPTAIATTLAGLRAKVGKDRIIAVAELGSYTMRTGVHKDRLQQAFSQADLVFCKETTLNWGLNEILKEFPQPTELHPHVEALLNSVIPQLRAGDHVVVMSNAAFEGIHQRLLDAMS